MSRLRGEVRNALRDATTVAHRKLDALWDGIELAERGDYAHFLAATAAALLPIEAGLWQSGAARVLPDWPGRCRSGALVDDLAALGLPAPTLDPVPVGTGADIFGVLYVLEGSRLGGATLLRRTEDAADPVIRENRRFLQHGQGRGLWRSFVERLDALVPSAAELDGMIERACAAFALFEAAARRSSEGGSRHEHLV